MKFVICSNVEELSECVCNDDWQDEIISVGLRAAWSELEKQIGPEYYKFTTEDATFQRWNGGRYDQFWKRCGYVAIDIDGSKSMEDIAWEVNTSMQDAMIEEYERLLVAEMRFALSMVKSQCEDERGFALQWIIDHSEEIAGICKRDLWMLEEEIEETSC